ncbi:MAG: phytoene dehydrogenase [Nitrospinae bacterium RIFCSPLOWO2_12_FULL_47_7]|nr:MAG: phytoene dehydrogenase [Nitrospinae bacterium RIFCSPLOWO2_12_FULL_47_7]
MVYDALIIGAGLSGLAAGIRLAMFDLKVCIVEKHTEIGGLNSFYKRKHRIFDVGLHAITNYTPKGTRSSPLGKILKQLRFSHDDFKLCQQQVSEIRFPEKTLRFSNEFDFFIQEIHEQFPRQIDGFQKLLKQILAFNELSLDNQIGLSARQMLENCLSDPLLADMLCCPLMYYGNARENDMDFYQFVIMFKSIFMEGFAKPAGGMPYILNLLVNKYKSLGGELRLGKAVVSIDTQKENALTLSDGGEILRGKQVISSMGYVETLRLCQPSVAKESEQTPGQVSFMESIFVLNRQPKDLGYNRSIVFYCTQPKFQYRVPAVPVDISSGVLCCSNNFNYPEPLPEGVIRITNLANFGLWNELPRKEYKEAKKAWREQAIQQLLGYFPDFRDSVVFSDTFTPKTVFKYTGHINGAVYGSPNKIKNGVTPVKNLFICGTDQGFLGIIGATLSGISMANLHVLKEKTTP